MVQGVPSPMSVAEKSEVAQHQNAFTEESVPVNIQGNLWLEENCRFECYFVLIFLISTPELAQQQHSPQPSTMTHVAWVRGGLGGPWHFESIAYHYLLKRTYISD